jgi:heme-degrading monooxygenase HmoA
MVRSILTRKTRLRDRAVWEGALETVLPRIREILTAEPGFVSVEYAWNTDEPGRFAQITTWASEDDCRRYVRQGSAATVATIEESAVPTAPYPEGRWVRENFSAPG